MPAPYPDETPETPLQTTRRLVRDHMVAQMALELEPELAERLRPVEVWDIGGGQLLLGATTGAHRS